MAIKPNDKFVTTNLLCITCELFVLLDACAVEACMDDEGIACAKYAAKGQCTDVEVSFACAKTCYHCKSHSEKLRESEKAERGELRREVHVQVILCSVFKSDLSGTFCEYIDTKLKYRYVSTEQ